MLYDDTPGKTFGERFPSLESARDWRWDDPWVRFVGLGEGDRNILIWIQRNVGPTIADILDITPDDVLQWRHIGVGKRDKIVRFLESLAQKADEGLEPFAPVPSSPPVPPAPPPDVEFETLVAWSRFAASATTWGEVERSLLGRELPEDVAAALQQVRQRQLPEEVSEPDAEVILAHWLESLSPRDRDILQFRMVKAPARTLDAIGQDHRVSRERIRQVEKKLKQLVPSLLAQEHWRPVRWEVFAQSQRLGAFAPLSSAEAEELGSEAGFPRALILWLAGYRRGDAHVRLESFGVPRLADVPFEDDEIQVDAQRLEERLRADGVAEGLVSWAIDQVQGIHRLDGAVVRWPNNIVDKSIAVLTIRDRPMNHDELAEAIGGGINNRGLRNRLMEDDRVIRVDRQRFGLKSWGGEAYTSIPALMIAYLEQHGDSPLSDIAADLHSRFGVKAASISMVSAAPVFVHDGGKLRLRRPDEPFQPRAAIHRVPGLFRAGADQLVWRVPADEDLIRGSGRAIPQEIAAFMGVTPGARSKLTAGERKIPLNWLETSHVGPQIGSVRDVVTHAGAELGDDVLLTFDRQEMTVSARVAATPSGESVQEQLAALTGLAAQLCASRAALAEALNMPDADPIDVLRARGDDAVADLADEL